MFLELVTYRLGAHSTSDDPTRYRDSKEVDSWLAKEPLGRAKRELIAAGQWTAAKEKALVAESIEAVSSAIAEAEASPVPSAETLFEDVYADAPALLEEQRQMLTAELDAAPRARP